MKSSSLNFDLENQIDNYINGRLNQDQADKLWAQLIEHDMLDVVKTSATVKKIILESETDASHDKVVGRIEPSGYLRYAAAAVAVLLIGVFTVTNFFLNQTENGFTPLQNIEYSIVRSGTAASGFDSILQESVSEAVNGNTELAVSMLQSLADQSYEPSLKAEALLNLGIIQYNSGNMADAEYTFTEVTQLPEVSLLDAEKAYWFMANAQLNRNNTEGALVNIRKVVEINGAYSRIARQALDSIQ